MPSGDGSVCVSCLPAIGRAADFKIFRISVAATGECICLTVRKTGRRAGRKWSGSSFFPQTAGNFLSSKEWDRWAAKCGSVLSFLRKAVSRLLFLTQEMDFFPIKPLREANSSQAGCKRSRCWSESHITVHFAFQISVMRPPFNSELGNMLEFNVQQEFGQELRLDPALLGSTNPVLVDGRMQPFEWMASSEGELLKTDAISHGDNHFFPGPCDIAWDLGGSNCRMGSVFRSNRVPAAQVQAIFRHRRGAKSSAAYMLAYCVFRLGFCKMAVSTVLGSREESRLQNAYRWYRSKAGKLLDAATSCCTILSCTMVAT